MKGKGDWVFRKPVHDQENVNEAFFGFREFKEIHMDLVKDSMRNGYGEGGFKYLLVGIDCQTNLTAFDYLPDVVIQSCPRVAEVFDAGTSFERAKMAKDVCLNDDVDALRGWGYVEPLKYSFDVCSLLLDCEWVLGMVDEGNSRVVNVMSQAFLETWGDVNERALKD